MLWCNEIVARTTRYIKQRETREIETSNLSSQENKGRYDSDL